MPTFTVTAVNLEPRAWNSTKGGPMLSYRVSLKDDATGEDIANVEWARKQASPKPEVGQQIEGTVDKEVEYGPKFKATPTGGFSGRGPRDPKEIAAIQRMHDQDMSLRAVDIATRLGLVAPETITALFELIAKTTDWFGRDTAKARGAA